jgi:hypothetical protein
MPVRPPVGASFEPSSTRALRAGRIRGRHRHRLDRPNGYADAGSGRHRAGDYPDADRYDHPHRDADARPGADRESSPPSPAASPTDTPEPQQFQTMDGVWEIESQTFGQRNATYSHLYLIQKDETLTGTWRREDKHVLGVTGTFDGRLFKLSAVDAATKVTYTLQGYVENYSDLVGQAIRLGPTPVSQNFTGQHRKKDKLGA